MSTNHERARVYLDRLRQLHDGTDATQYVPPAMPDEVAPQRLPNSPRLDPAAVERRWALLKAEPESRRQILDDLTTSQMEAYAGNIENFIGTAKVPIGVAGPLRVRGLFANGDYYVPLATVEATLVASYTRGCQTISAAGGCTSVVVNEGVSRAPAFAFADIREAGQFAAWVTTQVEQFREAAQTTTRHGRLVDVRLTLEGNHCFLLLEYLTGDAAGQNMVTIATEAVCQYIVASSPVKPRHWFVEGNMSGDKKASTQSFQSVRGKKVVAEATIPAPVVQRRLHADVDLILEYYRTSALGGVLSGTIGIQGHYANALAALFIACGQDAACVAEAAVGVTRLERTPDGGLYAAVTLPNILVGTVGGGTRLPSQRACLSIMGMAGDGCANAFAEVCGALVLAGELSIIAALAAGQFTRAHEKLARGSSR